MDIINFVSTLFTKMPTRKPQQKPKAQGELIGISSNGLKCVWSDVDNVTLARYDGKILDQISWGTDTPAESQIRLQVKAQERWGIEWELLPPIFDLSQWEE